MSDEEDFDEAEPIGWDAIDAALAPIYGKREPKHFGTILPAMLGFFQRCSVAKIRSKESVSTKTGQRDRTCRMGDRANSICRPWRIMESDAVAIRSPARMATDGDMWKLEDPNLPLSP